MGPLIASLWGKKKRDELNPLNLPPCTKLPSFGCLRLPKSNLLPVVNFSQDTWHHAGVYCKCGSSLPPREIRRLQER